jgi:hypothetical protein
MLEGKGNAHTKVVKNGARIRPAFNLTAKRLYIVAQGRAAHPGLMNRHLPNPNGVLQNDLVKPRWGFGAATAS